MQGKPDFAHSLVLDTATSEKINQFLLIFFFGGIIP
jgi:hypothetical protein